MSNMGYREVTDFGQLSLKQLNDNLRALWAKVMGEIGYRDLKSEIKAAIDSKVGGEELAGYSTLRQTQSAVEQAVANLNLSQYATLSVMASAITAALADKSGETQVSITAAEGLKITQSNLGSYFQVNAERAGFFRISDGQPIAYLGSENGAGYFATNMIRDPAVDSNFKIWISSLFGWSMRFNVSGADYGGFHIPARFMPRRLLLDVDQLNGRLNPGAGLRFGAITNYDYLIEGADNAPTVFVSGNILPEGGDLYALGSSANGARFFRLFCVEAPSVSSDERLKKEIAPLNALGLLKRLRPRRFRLKANDKRLRFGFIAQEARAALKEAGLAGAGLLDDANPEQLALCYEELIAVLTEGWQRHEERIAALEARGNTEGGETA